MDGGGDHPPHDELVAVGHLHGRVRRVLGSEVHPARHRPPLSPSVLLDNVIPLTGETRRSGRTKVEQTLPGIAADPLTYT